MCCGCGLGGCAAWLIGDVVVFRVTVVVAVLSRGGFDIIADDAQEADPAALERVEGAAALADGGLGEADHEEQAVAFWGKAEGVVADHDGSAVDDDVVVLGAGLGDEAVRDRAQEVLGGVRHGAAPWEEVEVLDLGLDEGGAPGDLLGECFGEARQP